MTTHHDHCPLCGGASAPRFWPVDASGKTWRIDRCHDCGLGFLNPTLSGAELDPFYSDAYYGPNRRRFSGGVEGMIPLFRKARARRVKRLIPPKGAVLDVGCGRGLMLVELAGQGYRCVGTERSDAAAEAARAAGVEVIACDIGDSKLEPASFDIVTFWQALEHLDDPRDAIKKAARLLKPGGCLLAQVPDIDGFQAKVTGKYWFHLDPPHHLWHFNMKSLDLVMRDAGLQRERIGHLSIEYGPFGLLQSLLNLTGIRRDLLYDLLMSRDRKTLMPSAIARGAMWGAAALLAAPSFAACLIASTLKSGSVIEAVYRKRD